MPPRKTSKKKNIQKQKIAARLIEISLKVDDYIYNKKPILVEAAREYGEEIALFVPKCQGDARSLQVIEKLTRIMKNIIGEKPKPAHEGTFLLSQSANNIQILNDTPESLSRSIQVQTISFSGTTQEDKENKDDNIDSNTTNTESLLTEYLEVDLERTLSNLSLSIIDTFNKDIAYFKKASPLEGSKNVNNNSTDKIDVIDSNDCSENITKITTTLQDTTAINTIGVDLQKTSNKETSIMVVTDLNMDLPENHIIKPNILSSVNGPTTNDILATEPYGNHDVDAINLTRSPNNPTQSNNQRKTQNKIRKRNEIPKTKKSAGAKRKVLNNSNIITDNGTIKAQNKKKKRRSNNKKGDVSDLSWVENLKYVRVINNMEYDTNLSLEDSFWNNCSLPSDWNDYF